MMNETNTTFYEGPLNDEQRCLVESALTKAHILYEGKLTAHRSCGICLAETFGLPWKPYQTLRKGGLTGLGECGAIRAGEMVLGECVGPDAPDAPAGDLLVAALKFYRGRWAEIQQKEGWADTICNTLTAPLGEFMGPERCGFCTSMAARTAEITAETLIRCGHEFEVVPFEAEGA